MFAVTRLYLFMLVLLLFVALASPQQTIQAATFSVSTDAELIAAINTANGNGEADTITLTTDITLTAIDNMASNASGLPVITSAITIEGAGFTIARDGAVANFRIFRVDSTGGLTLNNLTISNGSITGGAITACGGGIDIFQGTVTLNNSTVSGNTSSEDGGGICNDSGTVTLINSTLSGNSASMEGGGILNIGTVTLNSSTVSGNSSLDGGGVFNMDTLTVTNNSTVMGNSVTQHGGGIYNMAVVIISNSTLSDNYSTILDGGGLWNGGIAEITNSTFSGNSAPTGGGVRNEGGDVTLNDSTLSGNTAPDGGGGLINPSGTVTINNSTLSDNTATGSGGGGILNGGTLTITNSTISGNTALSGGGIFNLEGDVSLNNSTLSGNDATGFDAGGIVNRIDSTVTVNNSIIANSVGGDCYDEAPGGFSGTNNLAAGDCAGISIGTVTGLDPVLADNGGATMTHALLPGSNAIDVAPTGTPMDQRGVPAVGVRDIGAFEYGAVLPVLSFAVDYPTIHEDSSAGPTVATVTVTLDNPAGGLTAGEVTTDFGITGTATEGASADFDYQQGGTALPFTFTGGNWPAPGAASTQTFTLTTWEDVLVEGDETINMTVSLSGPAILTGEETATVTIIDVLPHAISITVNEQELQNQLQTGITTNPNVQEIEVAVVDFVPGALNITIRTTEGIEGDVTVTVTDTGSGFATLTITGITVRGNESLATYSAIINRELPTLLVDSLDQVLYEVSWSDLNTLSVTNTVIEAEISR